MRNLIKVLFIFNHHMATSQNPIVMKLPIDHVPKVGDEVTFNYELVEDLQDTLTFVSEVQYVFNKKALQCIKLYLKSYEL